MVAAKSFITT